MLIGAANGESGARQLGDEVATGGGFGFQRKLADDMVRAGQSIWMFQLTYVPPQARASRFAPQHGESVAYAFGTIGQSIAAQYGFRNEQIANNAARSRRGGGNRPTGGGREDDSQPVAVNISQTTCSQDASDAPSRRGFKRTQSQSSTCLEPRIR